VKVTVLVSPGAMLPTKFDVWVLAAWMERPWVTVSSLRTVISTVSPSWTTIWGAGLVPSKVKPLKLTPSPMLMTSERATSSKRFTSPWARAEPRSRMAPAMRRRGCGRDLVQGEVEQGVHPRVERAADCPNQAYDGHRQVLTACGAPEGALEQRQRVAAAHAVDAAQLAHGAGRGGVAEDVYDVRGDVVGRDPVERLAARAEEGHRLAGPQRLAEQHERVVLDEDAGAQHGPGDARALQVPLGRALHAGEHGGLAVGGGRGHEHHPPHARGGGVVDQAPRPLAVDGRRGVAAGRRHQAVGGDDDVRHAVQGGREAVALEQVEAHGLRTELCQRREARRVARGGSHAPALREQPPRHPAAQGAGGADDQAQGSVRPRLAGSIVHAAVTSVGRDSAHRCDTGCGVTWA
jgi:hypothetical protein